MAARDSLSLPIFPELTEPEVRTVTRAVADYFAR
jgi:dTDP-4-amino-4,6-dideoxygalactose transaminase